MLPYIAAPWILYTIMIDYYYSMIIYHYGYYNYTILLYHNYTITTIIDCNNCWTGEEAPFWHRPGSLLVLRVNCENAEGMGWERRTKKRGIYPLVN